MTRKQFAGSALPESIDELVDRVQSGDGRVETESLVRRWADRGAAPDSIPKLLEILRAKAPKADAAVCLLLVRVLERNPDADCDVEPILEVLERGVWASQFRAAYVLYYAWSGNDALAERACRSLIPLVASQRGRVVYPALRCLSHITGEDFGRDPAAWSRWSEQTYGSRVDPTAGVHELLSVIRPHESDPFKPPWDLNGKQIDDKHQLLSGVREVKRIAEKRKIAMKVVMHSDHAAEEFDRPKLLKVFRESLMIRLITLGGGVEIAHASEEFYPPVI